MVKAFPAFPAFLLWFCCLHSHGGNSRHVHFYEIESLFTFYASVFLKRVLEHLSGFDLALNEDDYQECLQLLRRYFTRFSIQKEPTEIEDILRLARDIWNFAVGVSSQRSQNSTTIARIVTELVGFKSTAFSRPQLTIQFSS